MGSAADGAVIDSDGNSAQLHDFLGGKPTVLSFIFTTCDDVNGCPLATYVMRSVQDALRADPATADKARLVSFSFDPVFDTPDVIDAYGSQFRAGILTGSSSPRRAPPHWTPSSTPMVSG
jgi:cytochrome c peroxidase